uniref:Peptidase_M13 domain-containing protein n=1 Tax=Parastrongyloides trichosuri TaxID=131310 RepID=A0A0N4ZHN4_PARTI
MNIFLTILLILNLHIAQIVESHVNLYYDEEFTLNTLNEHIDWEVDPCDDFHEFVCGTFFKNNFNGTNSISYNSEGILRESYYNSEIISVALEKEKSVKKVADIHNYFANYNDALMSDVELYLEYLYSYVNLYIKLNYFLKYNNITFALKFAQKVFRDVEIETKLLIKEKDWLDKETKEMLLEKLKTLVFNYDIYKVIANKEYFDYCIDDIPFDSSKHPRKVVMDIRNHIFKWDYFLDDAGVIGHEILHAFDRRGRTFDQYGNLKNLTTEKSDKEFQMRERCLIYQYGNQTIEDIDKKVNGTATLDENLGDNGAIKLAYRAYLKYVKRLNYKMKPLKGKKELSPNQLFFVGGGKFWCLKYSQKLLSEIAEGPHAPVKIRLNTYVSNFKPFAKAFNCKIGTPMNPKNKCEVWKHK